MRQQVNQNLKRWAETGTPPSLPRVRFYTRQGCHLCTVALRVVEAVGREVAFSLDIVDIDQDEEARERYWDSIPVVEINGQRFAKYRVDAEAFRAALTLTEKP